MSDSFAALQSRYGDRYDLTQLEAYFRSVEEGAFAGHEDSEVNLLSPLACMELTDEFREFHPLFEADELLELLILDDANTSNHHCYAFGLPYPSSVIYFPHDDTTRIAFRSISEFLDGARDAIAKNRFLTDFHTNDVLLSPDQAALNQKIRTGYDAGDEKPVWLLLQSSELSDTDLMLQIARDVNFYFGETVANRILAQPTAEMLPIAEACSQHKVEQVSRPGKLAFEAVKALQ